MNKKEGSPLGGSIMMVEQRRWALDATAASGGSSSGGATGNNRGDLSKLSSLKGEAKEMDEEDDYGLDDRARLLQTSST